MLLERPTSTLTLNELGYRHTQWLRDLTREALNRAGLRRNRT